MHKALLALCTTRHKRTTVRVCRIQLTEKAKKQQTTVTLSLLSFCLILSGHLVTLDICIVHSTHGIDYLPFNTVAASPTLNGAPAGGNGMGRSSSGNAKYLELLVNVRQAVFIFINGKSAHVDISTAAVFSLVVYILTHSFLMATLHQRRGRHRRFKSSTKFQTHAQN